MTGGKWTLIRKRKANPSIFSILNIFLLFLIWSFGAQSVWFMPIELQRARRMKDSTNTCLEEKYVCPSFLHLRTHTYTRTVTKYKIIKAFIYNWITV